MVTINKCVIANMLLYMSKFRCKLQFTGIQHIAGKKREIFEF